ncbi:MAG: DUF115 domain-containing protein [Treponema sp.]|nr:DUF115 domain-containing protein [Treponema sp.]
MDTGFNEKLIIAKNDFTVKVGEITIHSIYNPKAEAEKYIDSLNLKPYKYFILIEPGLNYLAFSLKNKFSASQIISLHCSSFFSDNELSWNPASAETLEDFLERLLFNTDASEVKLIDWKPSVNAYGKACLDLISVTVELIKRVSAGRKTIQNFGKRWFKNALNNMELINNTVFVKTGSMQILVCASGPSLEDSINDIFLWKKKSPSLFIIAVSSAAPVLLFNGIKPDIVITTDGGSWAGFHLIEFIRHCKYNIGERPYISAALTANLPSHIDNYPVIVLRDGSLWQNILLQQAGYFSLEFPQRGTVSVSALDFAFYLTTGNVYICGMDFSHRDLLTHARPYAFEKISEQKQNRKNPLYSQFFERQNMIHHSGSHNIYASWFSTHLSSFDVRLYSVGKSIFKLPAGKPFLDDSGTRMHFAIQNKKKKTTKKDCIDILFNSIKNPLMTKQLEKELGELLLPDMLPESSNYSDEIVKVLLELSDE